MVLRNLKGQCYKIECGWILAFFRRIVKNPFEHLWFLCLAIDPLSLTYHSVHDEEQLTMRDGYKNNNGRQRQ